MKGSRRLLALAAMLLVCAGSAFAVIPNRALQFVRKVSGFAKPSHANAEAFERAVDEVTEAARRLIFSLHSAAPPRDRETEARKARERSRLRYG